jgi:hypothetical protein
MALGMLSSFACLFTPLLNHRTAIMPVENLRF